MSLITVIGILIIISILWKIFGKIIMILIKWVLIIGGILLIVSVFKSSFAQNTYTKEKVERTVREKPDLTHIYDNFWKGTRTITEPTKWVETTTTDDVAHAMNEYLQNPTPDTLTIEDLKKSYKEAKNSIVRYMSTDEFKKTKKDFTETIDSSFVLIGEGVAYGWVYGKKYFFITKEAYNKKTKELENK